MQPLHDVFDKKAFPNLLVGLEKADDAAVYQLNSKQAIINTTDFFPPIVDDPYDFGAIAAANAMSDVYAMGGQVLFAVNLAAFPDDQDLDLLREILRGGADKVAEAGAVIAGGHTVNDKEPKYGLAVTGIIDPAVVKRKHGASPGDILLLTKPLGVGVVTTALKNGRASAEDVAFATANMKLLNRQAAEAALIVNAHAMTDVTGFGLLGHAYEMVNGTPVDFHFDFKAMPWTLGVHRYGEMGAFPGGMSHNRMYFYPHVTFGEDVPELIQQMLWTPETSGGLLVAVDPDSAERYSALCPSAVVIGQVTMGSGHLFVT
ncbi:MAG: selenide, water dikinase SelD [Anaerolineae bacterium]|nr:selenide, water dikinase SelD [Anaerolineae bacterium]MCO5207886.1 selenide, water dikinase SelD [Anaerolineae bacterium]